MWKNGTIGVPVADGVVIVKWEIKVFEEGSVFGINGGRISKLSLRANGKELACYDRGWVTEPAADDQVAQVALAIVLMEYN